MFTKKIATKGILSGKIPNFAFCYGIIQQEHLSARGRVGSSIRPVPVLCSRVIQRRKFIEDNGFTEYAGLWMLGIMLYILGTVLCSFITFLVITYCRPGFIYEQAQAAVDVYRTMPQMRDNDMVNLLQQAIDDKALPSPIELVMSVFWFVSFAGSLVSALTALVAQRPLTGKSARRRQ